MKHIAKQLRDLADQIESGGQHHAPKTSALIHKHFGRIIGDAFDRNCRELDIVDFVDNIDSAFEWVKSPEGHYLWKAIKDMIKENNLT